MKVRINLTSNTEIHFHVQENTLISELKQLVYNNIRIATHTFQLVFKEEILLDDQPLSHYHIKDDDLLDIQGDLNSTLFPVLSTKTIFEIMFSGIGSLFMEIMIWKSCWDHKDFLQSLIIWWTPREKMEEHNSLPQYNLMQHIIMIWEHTLQAPFDINSMQSQEKISERLKLIKEAIRKCDGLQTKVLDANKKLLPESQR